MSSLQWLLITDYYNLSFKLLKCIICNSILFQCEYWRCEYNSQVEVANEALADRDGSREKADRLNRELSRVLSGDKERIIDIDALCMENK